MERKYTLDVEVTTTGDEKTVSNNKEDNRIIGLMSLDSLRPYHMIPL